MLLTYLLLIVLALLIGFFIGLPVSKKRPIFIRELGCSILLLVLLSLAAVVNSLLYLIAAAAGLLLYLARPWVIYGVSRDQINSALERAALATRTPCLKADYGYKLDNDILIKVGSFGKRFHILKFKSPRGSKKAKLTKNVSRKFIQNYFTSTQSV